VNCELYGISSSVVRVLHSGGIRDFGGSDGELNPAGIDGVVGSAINSAMYFDIEGQPNLLAFVGYLVYKIAKDHYFVDGNKRLAWSVLVAALANDGLSISADQDEGEALIQGVSTDLINVEGIIDWIAARVVQF
jgi:death on curing protein